MTGPTGATNTVSNAVIYTYSYTTSNAATSGFSTGNSTSVTSYVSVFVNGIYQPPGTYAFSGNLVTLTSPAPNGASVVVSAIQGAINNNLAYTKYSYTATGGQTTFSANYIIGYVDVYYNGLKLSTADYTASTGSTIVLASGAVAGSTVEIIGWNGVGIGGTGPTGAAGTSSGSNITVINTNTNSTFYPAFFEATSGSIAPRVDTALTYNPGTDQLTAGAFIPSSSTAPTNGMYLAAANQLGFATNSGEKIRVDSTGNVGIGTTVTTAATFTVQTIAGATASGSAYFSNGTYWLRHIPQTSTGSYNPMVSTNDQTLIYSAGTVDTGNLFIGQWSNNPRGIKITTNGNVGIGVTSPAYNLHVGGSIGSSGEITAYASDERLKTNIHIISDSVDKIKRIKGVTFDWRGNVVINGFTPKFVHDVGVLAQDVASVLPQAIRNAPFDANEDGSSRSGENYLTVQYEKLTALLIEAVKEQQQQIESQGQRITLLENIITGMKGSRGNL